MSLGPGFTRWVRSKWASDHRRAVEEARRVLGLGPGDQPRSIGTEATDRVSEIPYPDTFHRYCPQHMERLNWLLCPKGHQLGTEDEWLVKDESTGVVVATCRDNDGTQGWRGFAPRN